VISLFRENISNYLVIILWVILGKTTPSIAQIFIPISFLYFIIQKNDLFLLIGMLLAIVISDNYYSWWIAPIKPIMLILLFLYTLFSSDLKPFRSFTKAFYLFFAYGVCLFAVSDYFSASVQKFSAYILMFLTIPSLIFKIQKEYGKDAFKHLTLFCVVVIGVSFLYKYVDPYSSYSHGGRLRGTFGNPNGLGMFVFFALSLFEISRKYLNLSYSRLEVYFIYVLFGLVVIATGSRSSLVAIGLFYLFRKFGGRSIAASVLILIGIIVFFQFFLNDLVQFLISIGLGDTLRLNVDGAQSVETGSGRLVAWNFAWEEIQKNLVFGKGWAHEEELFHSERIQLMLNMLNHEGGAHNIYLIFWMNTGIVGLILFFVPLINVFNQAYRKSKDMLPFLFGGLFLGSFEPWLAGPLNPYTITMLIILSMVFYFTPETQRNEENPEGNLVVT
jgi:O-antigen ligase